MECTSGNHTSKSPLHKADTKIIPDENIYLQNKLFTTPPDSQVQVMLRAKHTHIDS